ncbi:MAG: hypothetical protein R2911_41785 [Caldilineaceae bacterium]
MDTSRACPPDLMPTDVRAMAAVAWHAAKERDNQVTHALCNQLGIGLQAYSGHLAGHGAAEQ